MTRHFASTATATVALATACAAHTPPAVARRSVTVDVARTESTEIRAVRQLWESYLASKAGRLVANASAASTPWSAAEQRRWPLYDLAGSYVPDGAAVRALELRSTGGASHEYEIVTEFRDDPSGSAAITTTVYATREDGRWVLANALPRNTVRWSRKTVAPIHYFIEPGLTFDSARAARAATFVDSLADALDVPRVDSLDYYVASSVDAALNALGVRYPVRYGPNGGFSKPVDHQVFSGNPALGENYRHELTHVVVLPLLARGTTTLLASEGLSTWLGGTEGADFRGSVRSLARFLAAHPSVTLDSVMNAPSTPQAVRYASGAVLCMMVSDAGGISAVERFLQASAPDVRAVLAQQLQRPWANVAQDWRRTVDRLASP